jgi:hypothetical protein
MQGRPLAREKPGDDRATGTPSIYEPDPPRASPCPRFRPAIGDASTDHPKPNAPAHIGPMGSVGSFTLARSPTVHWVRSALLDFAPLDQVGQSRRRPRPYKPSRPPPEASQTTDSGTHRTDGFGRQRRPSPLRARSWVRSAQFSLRKGRFESHRLAGAGRWVRSAPVRTRPESSRPRTPELGSVGAFGPGGDDPRIHPLPTHIVKELPHIIVICPRIVHAFRMATD